jgi:hypothetical protein
VITDVSPSTISSYTNSTLVVTGTDLGFVNSVTFGAENPTPTQITQASFEIEDVAATNVPSLIVESVSLNGAVANSDRGPIDRFERNLGLHPGHRERLDGHRKYELYSASEVLLFRAVD